MLNRRPLSDKLFLDFCISLTDRVYWLEAKHSLISLSRMSILVIHSLHCIADRSCGNLVKMAEIKDFELFKQVDLSDYARKLSSSDLAVYLDKLSVDDGTLPDPYNVSDCLWEDNLKEWPDLAYPDIYTYFVESTSYYSRAQMKCYKSMDAYQYFVCGHVQQVLLHNPNMGNMVYLKANVLPSQRQGTKKDMYSAYLVVVRDGDDRGQIHTAHCTCMAGVGKACSHAAALAYKVEAAVRLGLKETARTSPVCSWKDMSRKKAQPAPLEEIDFKKPKYGEDVRTDPTREDTDQNTLPTKPFDFETLRNIQPDAVVFSCLDVKERPTLPPTMIEVISRLHSEKVPNDEMLSIRPIFGRFSL